MCILVFVMGVFFIVILDFLIDFDVLFGINHNDNIINIILSDYEITL